VWRTIWTPLVLSVSVIAIAGGTSLWGNSVTQSVVIQAGINLDLVVGLYIFVGNSGVLHFGHIAFMAIGAYVAAYLTIPPESKAYLFPDLPGSMKWVVDAEVSYGVAAIIAGGIAAGLAIIFAFPLMRLGGVQAGIGTFAALVIVNVVLTVTTSVTRGTSAVFGIPEFTTMTVIATCAVASIVCAYLYQISSRGLRLKASREDESAARAIGINIPFERSVAFVISAFVCGVGGALFAGYLTTFNPDAFYVKLTFLNVAMLVIGGTNSLTGAVTGVVFVSTLRELLRRVEIDGLGPIHAGALPGLTEIVLGAILILTLIVRPSGIAGGREVPLPRSSGLGSLMRTAGIRRGRAGD
jgi:branched-chain amino acid transport system permease protein